MENKEQCTKEFKKNNNILPKLSKPTSTLYRMF